jgi:FMN phosphatase YigB (HAD superfamily)
VITTYLFDWGDTLMVDFPDAAGKMCDWTHVEAVAGAHETLAELSKSAHIYIATGAADSTEDDIRKAFRRVGLSQFITGYFCKDNLGVDKGSAAFFTAVLAQLDIPAAHIMIVGDNYAKDIEPALRAGITPIWFVPDINQPASREVRTIRYLRELYTHQGEAII